MEIQSILSFLILGFAVGFLVKKFFFKKKKTGGDCGEGDCGCH